MKKVFTVFVLVIVTVSLFVGCGNTKSSKSSSSSNSTKEDIVSSVKKDDTLAAALPDSVKNAGEISIGIDDSYPPMEYRNDKNTLVGFDIDFGNAIGKKLGVKINWVPNAWDGIIPALQSKKFDMILSSMSITNDRKEVVNFSDPYITGGPIIVVKKGTSTIKTEDDLKGRIVGVQMGSTGEEAVSKISGVKETKKYDKITEALQDLSAGRVEAVVADDQVGRYYVGLAGNLYSVAGKLHDEPFGIAFRKNDTDLSEVVQKAMNDLKADGTLSKISIKWFKTDLYK